MNDYIKKDKLKKLKRYLLTIIFIFLVFIICILSYYIYEQIEITDKKAVAQNPTIQRTSQSVEQVNQESKQISDVIEDVNKSVVGISKVKNTGNTIFMPNSISKLGLGTGIIVSDNGYILTNEHVSGKKYNSCYITLSTR